MLRQWAAKNGYRLIDYQYRQYFRGPFRWTYLTAHLVFRVAVEDAEGKRRQAWVCCGSSFLGILLSDKVTAVWDEAA